MKEIAELAQVSRGTVDRVIHGRGKVSPEVYERVKKILEENNYEPNTAAVALKSIERKLSIGVIVPDLNNEFFCDVYEGIKDASKRYADFGITVYEYFMKNSSSDELIAGIDAMLEQNVNGLVMQAVDTERVQKRLNELPKDFPFITFNSDFSNSRRLCFVGQDSYAAGRVAGHMMAMMLHRVGKIAIIAGNAVVESQSGRSAGFRSAMEEQRPYVPILGPFHTLESEDRAYEITKELLEREENLVGIYAAGGGQVNVAKALKDSGKALDIVMVGHDLLKKTVEYMMTDVVNCTIAQAPYEQGYLPIELLSKLLLFQDRPEKDHIYTAIDIRIKDNVSQQSGYLTHR